MRLTSPQRELDAPANPLRGSGGGCAAERGRDAAPRLAARPRDRRSAERVRAKRAARSVFAPRRSASSNDTRIGQASPRRRSRVVRHGAYARRSATSAPGRSAALRNCFAHAHQPIAPGLQIRYSPITSRGCMRAQGRRRGRRRIPVYRYLPISLRARDSSHPIHLSACVTHQPIAPTPRIGTPSTPASASRLPPHLYSTNPGIGIPPIPISHPPTPSSYPLSPSIHLFPSPSYLVHLHPTPTGHGVCFYTPTTHHTHPSNQHTNKCSGQSQIDTFLKLFKLFSNFSSVRWDPAVVLPSFETHRKWVLSACALNRD